MSVALIVFVILRVTAPGLVAEPAKTLRLRSSGVR